eukprot:scaffold4498_cov119-Isochrysis_galbana.AAC.25
MQADRQAGRQADRQPTTSPWLAEQPNSWFSQRMVDWAQQELTAPPSWSRVMRIILMQRRRRGS